MPGSSRSPSHCSLQQHHSLQTNIMADGGSSHSHHSATRRRSSQKSSPTRYLIPPRPSQHQLAESLCVALILSRLCVQAGAHTAHFSAAVRNLKFEMCSRTRSTPSFAAPVSARASARAPAARAASCMRGPCAHTMHACALQLARHTHTHTCTPHTDTPSPPTPHARARAHTLALTHSRTHARTHSRTHRHRQ